MSWTARLVLAAALVGVSGAWPLLAHRDPASIVIVTGQEATAPVPTLIENRQNTLANQDVADQLFLRLADVGPGMVTAGDQGFVPMLARSWTRRDSLTLVFDLDPRARWHDGAPVTSRDVLFTLRRARDSAVAPRLANVTRRIASVEAEGEHRVVFRFRKLYAEQLYDATFHTAIVPAHLLEQLPPTPEAWAEFATHPVGSGPYRWVRRQPGEFIELAANEDFFLGAPAIKRVIVRVAVNADARLNLLLAGEADATENIPPPITNIDRVKESKHLRVVPVPSSQPRLPPLQPARSRGYQSTASDPGGPRRPPCLDSGARPPAPGARGAGPLRRRAVRPGLLPALDPPWRAEPRPAGPTHRSPPALGPGLGGSGPGRREREPERRAARLEPAGDARRASSVNRWPS